jgi:hypothetical protein
VALHPAGAAELAEMLGFISQWLAGDPALQTSLTRFTGHPALTTQDLQDDLDRFIFLLGESDGQDLFGLGESDSQDLFGGDEPAA